MDGAPPRPCPTLGRGAPSNPGAVRTGASQRIADSDWLDAQEGVDGKPSPLRTSVRIEAARRIITRNTSPDLGFDRSINSYRGCEHGCIYCYARPTHAYHDLSPGLDFETQLFAKPDGANLLRRELAAPRYAVAPLAIGTNTYPYQPIERDWRLTREIVEVMAECRHPLLITTKSDRIMRDIDLLKDMAREDLVSVAISITTLDPALARTLEPRAPRPAKRLAAVAALAAAGIPVQVNISPIIPAISDHELESIIAAAASAGAYRTSYIVVRLPHEVAPLFREWLDAYFPERADKVMHIIEAMRGGRANDPAFHTRMKGTGIWAELIRARFKRAARAYGLDCPAMPLRTDAFIPPALDGQLALF